MPFPALIPEGSQPLARRLSEAGAGKPRSQQKPGDPGGCRSARLSGRPGTNPVEPPAATPSGVVSAWCGESRRLRHLANRCDLSKVGKCSTRCSAPGSHSAIPASPSVRSPPKVSPAPHAYCCAWLRGLSPTRRPDRWTRTGGAASPAKPRSVDRHGCFTALVFASIHVNSRSTRAPGSSCPPSPCLVLPPLPALQPAGTGGNCGAFLAQRGRRSLFYELEPAGA